MTSGAQNDLERATKLARRMVMEWGMSETLGPLTFGRPAAEHVFLGRDIARERNYSEEISRAIDREVKSLVQTAHQRARDILRNHWEELERVVKALLEKETLNREEFIAIMAGEPVPQATS